MLLYILIIVVSLALCYRNYGIRLDFGREGVVLCTGFIHLHVGLEKGTLIIKLSLLGTDPLPLTKQKQQVMPFRKWKSNRASQPPRRGQGPRQGGKGVGGQRQRQYGVGPRAAPTRG